MPNDTQTLPLGSQEPQFIWNTEQYPEDIAGFREVPVTHKDAFGRISRVEMKRVSPYEYIVWMKEEDNA